MSTHLRRVIVPALAAVLAAGLTGCGLTAPSGTSPSLPVTAPTITPAPTPTTTAPSDGASDPVDPAAASGEKPDPRAAIGCEDITSPSQVAPLFTMAVNLAPPSRTYEYVGASIAQEWAVRQAGGVACQWSDPEGIETSEGRYTSGIDVKLVPASDDQWNQFSAAVGDGSDRFLTCTDYSECQYDRYLSNGWWLSLDAFQIGDGTLTESAATTLFTPIANGIASTAGALAGPDPSWTLPVADAPFGPFCDSVITGARLTHALGLSGTAESEFAEYPSAASTAEDIAGETDCMWTLPGSGDNRIYIQVLPGGAWAQAEAKAAMEVVTGSPVTGPTVTGVPAGATALYHHVDSSALDIVIGGTWVKVAIGHGTHTGSLSETNALKAIAADIAAHV